MSTPDLIPGQDGTTTITYEEWRVTGDPGTDYRGHQYPYYDFTWTPQIAERHHGTPDPEAAARGFVAALTRLTEEGIYESKWPEGPTLTSRTVTITKTEWQKRPLTTEGDT